MIVVGLLSSYKEGRLVQGAIRSLLQVGLDWIYLYEGPAGEPIRDPDVPESDFGQFDPRTELQVSHEARWRYREGRWRTDGRKRNAMLQQAKTDAGGEPFWCVVVDADELLVNGEYLRDRLQALTWDDEARAADPGNTERPPWARWPLRLVEADGSLSLITARVFRGDLIRSIDHSSSVVTNEHGVREGWGNYAEASKVWIEGWLRAIDQGKMIAWPPLPGEPHIVHRSNLRHPLRRGLRMSDQELQEFARAQRDGE